MELIDSKNISIELMKDILGKIYIDYEDEVSYLVVKMQKEILLSIEGEEKKRLYIRCGFIPINGAHEYDKMKYINTCNSKYVLISSYMDDDGDIWFEATHEVEGGVTEKNLVHFMRWFDSLVISCLNEENAEGVLS